MICSGCEKEMKLVHREPLAGGHVEEGFVCGCGRHCVARTGTNPTWGTKDAPAEVGTPRTRAAIAAGKAPKAPRKTTTKKPASKRKTTKSAAKKRTRKKK